MLWFVRLGTILERTLTPPRYILFLAGAALVGSCAELAVDGETGVGASGVVYAMFGLMWAGRGRYDEWRRTATQDNLKYFLVWGVFCLIGTWMHFLNIANAAHGAGLLFGLALGWLLVAPRRRPLWAIPLALLGVVCVLSLTWMPWSWAWNWWKGNRELSAKHYTAAIAAYERSLRTGGQPSALWHNLALAWEGVGETEHGRNHDAAAVDALTRAEAAWRKSKGLEAQEAVTDKSEESSDDPADSLVDKLREKAKREAPATHK